MLKEQGFLNNTFLFIMFSKRLIILTLSFAIWLQLFTATRSQTVVDDKSSQEEAYSQAIAARSRAIVDKLELSDKDCVQRTEQLIAEQYRALREIHDSRDAEIASLKDTTGENEQRVGVLIERVRQDSMIKQFNLHRSFVAQLAVELTSDQVNGVKDGMTYGVVPATYARYLQKLPNLSEDEKRTVLAFLIEAREYAMDAGTSDEKHGWFRKYKGKINNYLSAAGYKM